MPREEINERAIRLWGVDPQLDMVIEEMAELTQAILKFKRRIGPARMLEFKEVIDRVAEEQADVRIMLDQLSTIMSQYDQMGTKYQERIKSWTELKVTRLVNLMDRQEGN